MEQNVSFTNDFQHVTEELDDTEFLWVFSAEKKELFIFFLECFGFFLMHGWTRLNTDYKGFNYVISTI